MSLERADGHGPARSRDARGPAAETQVDAILVDLLMAVMDSPSSWAAAARSRAVGTAWRDAATSLMRDAPGYVPYLTIISAAAEAIDLETQAVERLLRAWPRMRRWPDAAALESLDRPYAFVTNCSRALAMIAAHRSGLVPRFVLTAEEAGVFKPDAAIYHEGCRRIASEPARTAFVAGSSYDAVGARDAGLVTFLVVRRGPAPEIPGVRVVETLDGVRLAFGDRV